MRDAGHEVIACAGEPYPTAIETLHSWGVKFVPIRLSRAGMRPWEDLQTFFELNRIIRELRPDIVLAYTIKPVIWGGLAARFASACKNKHNTETMEDQSGRGQLLTTTNNRKFFPQNELKTFSLITGLGYAFMGERTFKARLTGWVAKHLYRLGIKSNQKVFFQNPDDKREFLDQELVDEARCVVVSGSGVDIDHYKDECKHPSILEDGINKQIERSASKREEKVCFLLIARLLWDKGIGEYVQAARLILNAQGNSNSFPQNSIPTLSRFLLVGKLDPNPSSVNQDELDKWIHEGTIEYLGYLEDVRPAYEKCSVYVLPSYREGTPRTVLEAMAMGRPIITTDAPGCRETVKKRDENDREDDKAEVGNETRKFGSCDNDGWTRMGKLKIGANGILIPPKDAAALAEAMRFFIQNPEEIMKMGQESRRYAEDRYDVHKVNEVMMRQMGLIRS